MKIDPQVFEIIKSVIPVVSALMGAWLAGRISIKNTLKSLEIQNQQKLDEWKRTQEADRHKQLQQWFYDYAVEGCINVLLAEIFAVQQRVLSAPLSLPPKEEQSDRLDKPVTEACVRLFVITGSLRCSPILVACKTNLAVLIKSNDKGDLNKLLSEICLYLIRIKQYLINFEIKTKSDIYSISSEDRIIRLADGIDERISQTLANIAGEHFSEYKVPTLTRMLRDMNANLHPYGE